MSHKIIVEGVDGSGKTTYIKNLLSQDGYEDFFSFHCTRTTENSLEYFMDLLTDTRNIVFDRFHIGQFIYQSSEERKKKGWLSLKDLETIEEYISQNNVEIIYLYSDPVTCYYNCKSDKDDSDYTLDYVKSLIKNYDFFFNNISTIPHLVKRVYNPMGVDIDNVDFSTLPKIVAVDFDGCLSINSEFPHTGEVNEKLKEDLFNGKYKDYKKILWTCRSGKQLEVAKDFCKANGLIFDAYNDNLDEVKLATHNDTRKIYADVYIDDKNVSHKKYF